MKKQVKCWTLVTRWGEPSRSLMSDRIYLYRTRQDATIDCGDGERVVRATLTIEDEPKKRKGRK